MFCSSTMYVEFISYIAAFKCSYPCKLCPQDICWRKDTKILEEPSSKNVNKSQKKQHGTYVKHLQKNEKN